MKVYLDFPPGWWLVLGVQYGCILILFLSSKEKVGDLKKTLKAGLITLVLGFLVELVGVSLKLWTLLPGNWPVTVWASYFGLGLLGYQIFQKTKEIKK